VLRLSLNEGGRRRHALRAFLTEHDCQAYVVFTSDNFFYVSNFHLDVQPWERPVAAIFPRDGDPVLILNELSTNHFQMAVARESCWVTDARIYLEHLSEVRRTYLRPEWDRLFVDTLRDLGVRRGRVAVDTLGPVSPGIRAALPDLAFEDRADVIRDLRLVKSAEELGLMRVCGELSDWGQAQFKALLAPGVPIIEVSLETARRLGVHVAQRHPAELIEVRASGVAGEDSICPHNSGANSGRALRPGDSVLSVVVLRINGYGVENERTYVIGPSSADQRRYFEVMSKAQHAAIAVMTEGHVVAEIDAVAQAVHNEAGTSEYLYHRAGHGIGIAGHEYPDDTAFNYRPLRAGMVFSSEPALFVPGLGGFRNSDTVIVGPDAPEPVTRFTKRLDDLIIGAS